MDGTTTGIPDAREVAEALERLREAIDKCHAAEERARQRTASADARIDDADARIVDAQAQTAHADAHMAAAEAHMVAAEAHMVDAQTRAERADQREAAADTNIAEASRQADLAIEKSEEYQRALYHYTQLVRHRVANPLQIIQGMARTLLEQPDIDPGTRRAMIESIDEQTRVLERLTLFYPDRQGDEERELRAKPFE